MAKTTRTSSTTKAAAAPVVLKRQIEKVAASTPKDHGAETPDGVLFSYGLESGVFQSVRYLPMLTPQQAASLGAAADVVIVGPKAAMAVSKTTGREYRQVEGKATDIGKIDPLALPEGFRSFFKAMLRKRHKSAEAALAYCTKGLRRQARNNKPQADKPQAQAPTKAQAPTNDKAK